MPRGEVLAWPRTRYPARPRKPAHSSVSDRLRHQLEAAATRRASTIVLAQAAGMRVHKVPRQIISITSWSISKGGDGTWSCAI
jgi:hypothetical protein